VQRGVSADVTAKRVVRTTLTLLGSSDLFEVLPCLNPEAQTRHFLTSEWIHLKHLPDGPFVDCADNECKLAVTCRFQVEDH
jgi:hypothetical protein